MFIWCTIMFLSFLCLFTFHLLSPQMFQLPGGVWRAELSEVSHPTGSLWYVPQMPQLSHGFQIRPKHTEPHRCPTSEAHWRTGNVLHTHKPKQILPTQTAVSFSMELNFSLRMNWPSFYSFTGWSISVSCVTLFLPTSPCCTSTLTLI